GFPIHVHLDHFAARRRVHEAGRPLRDRLFFTPVVVDVQVLGLVAQARAEVNRVAHLAPWQGCPLNLPTSRGGYNGAVTPHPTTPPPVASPAPPPGRAPRS